MSDERREPLRLVSTTSRTALGKLGLIRQLLRVHEETEPYLASTVAQARSAGATWAQVGEVLGVSKQAAQQR